MKIRCPSCNAAYDMDESRVPAAGVNIKCPKCSNAFRVNRAGVAGAVPGEPVGPAAVPLPAPDRGGGAGASPPAGRPPGAAAPPSGPPPGVAPPSGRPPGASAPPPGRPPGAAAAPPAPAAEAFGLDFPSETDAASPGTPPGWAGSSHPAQKAPSPRPAPLTAQGLGSPVPLPSSRQPPPGSTPAHGNAALAMTPPASGGLDLDFGDAPPSPGGFDLDNLNVAQSPPVDPALDFAMGSQDSADLNPFEQMDVPAPAPASVGSAFMAGVNRAASSNSSGSSASGDDLAMLDFVEESAKAPAPSPGGMRWSVRRKSGKVFGPFDAPAIIAMLQQGQLFGNEDISTDGNYWVPITSESQFAREAKEKPQEPPGLAAAGGNRLPPPMIPVLGETAPTLSDPYASSPADSGPGRATPVWVKLLMRRLPLLAIVSVVLLIVGGGIAMGLFTDLGYFGSKAFSGKTSEGPSPASAKLADFDKLASEGTFASWQKALGAAQAGLQADDNSLEAKTDLAIAASKLSRRYGAAATELDKAKGATKRFEPETLPARLALAAIAMTEGAGRVPDVKTLLQDHQADPRAAQMIAEAHLLAREHKAAAQVLEDLLKSAPTGEVAMLRAETARLMEDRDAEEAALARADELVPGHVRAKLFRARLAVEKREMEQAEKLLAEVLQEPAVRALESREEALGHHLSGDLLALHKKWDEAAKQYMKAAEQDPGNARHGAAVAYLLLRQHKYQEAIPVFEKALEKAPADVELLIGQGRAHTGAESFPKANEALQAAKAKAPNDPAVLVADGDLQTALQKYPDAHKLYADAMKKDAKYVPALVADARVLLIEKKLEPAKTLLEKAVELAPESPDAQAMLGEYRLQAGESEGAKEAFTKALAADTDLPEARAGLGEALVRLGDDAGAKAEFARSVELDPRTTLTRERYSAMLWRTKDLEGALEQLKAALALEPKEARLHAKTGAVLLELDRIGEAESELKTALAQRDEEPIAHDYYGRLLSLKGDTGQAAEHLKRSVELDPENARTLYQLGLVFSNGEQLTDAAEIFRKAIAIDPKYVDALEQLGETLSRQSLFSDAAEIFKKVLELEPNRARAMESLADCEFKLEQTDDALKHFKHALATDPERISIHYKLGRAFEKLGKNEDAIKSYIAATKFEPNNAFPHYYLGFVYKVRGKKKDAIASFEKYLSIAKDAKDANEIRDEILYLKEK